MLRRRTLAGRRMRKTLIMRSKIGMKGHVRNLFTVSLSFLKSKSPASEIKAGTNVTVGGKKLLKGSERFRATRREMGMEMGEE